MNPLEATTPDLEIDEFTGKLQHKVQLQQNSMVYNPLNRNLLYTKPEIDSKIAAVQISVGTSPPSNPAINALWVDTN